MTNAAIENEGIIKGDIKVVVFDLDGTLYIGNTPIPAAVEKVNILQSNGIKVFFITNSATRSRRGVALKLSNMGFGASDSEVYPSSYALARYVANNHKGKKVYIVGDHGLVEEINNANIPIVENDESRSDIGIVAVGLDTRFTYEKMCKAHTAIIKGANFIAANPDPTYPLESGSVPGAGAIVASIETSTGKKPYIIGKPNTYIMELLLREQKIRKDEILFVGDRLDTDIAFAKNCGVKSVLVLTGAFVGKTIEDMWNHLENKVIRPDFIINSVADL